MATNLIYPQQAKSAHNGSERAESSQARPHAHTQDHNNHNVSASRRRQSSRSNRRIRQVYAALDLGTNNCRLLIATPHQEGFRVIDAFSRIVRLGEGLEASGKLSEDAMERAIQSLQVCAQKIKRRQVTLMRSVATEACRLASNRGEFVDRVRNETGLALDIISSQEEARLAVRGCQPLFGSNKKKAIVFDIGGGSTEIVAAEIDDNDSLEIINWISLPLGVVRLSESIDQTLSQKKFDEVAEQITTQLTAFKKGLGWEKDFAEERVQLIGSSGTVTTMASLHLQLPAYDRNIVDGSWLDMGRLKRLTREVAFKTPEQRAEMPCIGTDRANLLVPGCAILDAILNALPCDEICIADRGIREGVLRGLMGIEG